MKRLTALATVAALLASSTAVLADGQIKSEVKKPKITVSSQGAPLFGLGGLGAGAGIGIGVGTMLAFGALINQAENDSGSH